MPSTRNCKTANFVTQANPEELATKWFPFGRGNLKAIAKELNVTAPTAKTILVRLFGPDRVVFTRGRSGGTTLLPPLPAGMSRE